MQTLNHALAKSVLFLSSGDVSLRYRTREAEKVSGLLAAVPVTGGTLLLGSFAVLGSSPFGLFLSELTIVRAGFARGSPVFPLLLLALLGLAFVAFARTTAGMATGPPTATPSPYGDRGSAAMTAVPRPDTARGGVLRGADRGTERRRPRLGVRGSGRGAAGTWPAPAVVRTRAVALELERLYNHAARDAGRPSSVPAVVLAATCMIDPHQDHAVMAHLRMAGRAARPRDRACGNRRAAAGNPAVAGSHHRAGLDELLSRGTRMKSIWHAAVALSLITKPRLPIPRACKRPETLNHLVVGMIGSALASLSC